MPDSPANRTTTASVRLMPDELAAWRSAADAAGLSLSDWLRDRVGRAAQRSRRTAAADPALLAELARIGNNLNQLARLANGAGKLPALVELAGIRAELERLSCTSGS